MFETKDCKLLHGDCLELMKSIPDKSIDCIIADLPYGSTSCAWDVIIPFDKLWIEYKRIIREKGTIVLFGSEPFASNLRLSNLEWYKYDWVWQKNNAGNFQLVNYQPLKIHETISIFINNTPNMQFANIMKENMKRLNLKQKDLSRLQLSRNGKPTGWVSNKLNGTQLPTKEQWELLCELFKIENKYEEILNSIKYPIYNLELDDTFKILSNKNKGGTLNHMSSENKRDTYVQNKTGYPKSILCFDREVGSHTTQKPVPLLEFLVKTYTNEGNTILDNCMGSGSTGIACINTGRKFIGIELNEEYYEVARQRISQQIRNSKGD